MKNNLNNLNIKKWKNTPKKIGTKPTHPINFPGSESFQKKMAQKRPTTLIRIHHLHNYCVIIIIIYYYYLLLLLFIIILIIIIILLLLLLSYIHCFIVFACIGTFPPGQKLHLRVFFLVYARLTPPSWQMLQIQAGFTMFYPLGICYSLRTGNHDQ